MPVTRKNASAWRAVPPAARLLGPAGLLPFALLAIVAIGSGAEPGRLAQSLLVGYGAVILSFMGGCRWGLAAAGAGEDAKPALFVISVLPALYAWLASLQAFAPAAFALAVGFLALYLAERHPLLRAAAPPWWLALRGPLTAGAACSLAAAALAAL
jgi:hypothetical protein